MLHNKRSHDNEKPEHRNYRVAAAALTREWIKKLVCTCLVVSDSFATPWIVAPQAPLSMEFSRQECWVAISYSRGSSNPGIKLGFPDTLNVKITQSYPTIWTIQSMEFSRPKY